MTANINKNLTLADYEAWKKEKLAEEKRRTHNAESVKSDELYRIVGALNECCFNNEFHYIPLYFIPADLEAKHRDSVGLYGYGCIMISKPYYEEHGTDDSVINTLYHEMIHAYCEKHDIQDTDGDKHLEAFADVCEEHGGNCVWENSQYGYATTRLKIKKMKKVKQTMQQKGA